MTNDQIKALQENNHQLLMKNTQLSAEVQHWKNAQALTQTSAERALRQMHELMRSTVEKALGLTVAWGEGRKRRGCKDCDVSALLAEIERLRPLTLGSPAPSARNPV